MIPDILHDAKQGFLDVLGLSRTALDNTRLAVITGPNASGKSLLRRFISAICQQRNIDKMYFSQEARSESGFSRACIYGSENDDATGMLSARAIHGAFRNMRSKNNEHLVIFDEPEIGMSEEAQLGSAMFMAEEYKTLPDNVLGIIVMTHSRHYVNTLCNMAGGTFVNLGNEYWCANEWLNRKIVGISPQKLIECGHDKFQEFQKNVFAK